MVEPSLSALVRDMLPEEPSPDLAGRPAVSAALPVAAPGTVTPARDGRRAVALVVLEDGGAFVVPDECPHDGGPISDGFVEHGRLVCARHYREFDVCESAGRCPARRTVLPGVKRIR